MITDCHGHYTTAPGAHTSWRKAQRAVFDGHELPPPYPKISDDEIRESIEGSQLPWRTRDRPHDLLAAGVSDGGSLRRRCGKYSMGRGEQRPHRPCS
jgi:hypothetical protein